LTRDEIVCLRLFQLNWALIAIALLSFCFSLLLTNFRIACGSYLIMLGVAALYGIVGHLNERSGSRDPRIYATFTMLAQIIFAIVLITSLGYVAAAANLPMQEANLLALDRKLGLDFHAYLNLVNDWVSLHWPFMRAYNSIHRQLIVLILILPLFGHHRRAAEFALAYAIALIVTTIISTLAPATGVYHALGIAPADHPNIDPVVYYDTLKELPLVRDGTTRLLDAFSLGPLLTFPSFHAISAALYIWAISPFRWLRIAGLLLNVAMLAATPIWGGHFFVDVATGLFVAVAVIYAVRFIGKQLTGDPQHLREEMMTAVPLNSPV
jgi:PAP2 superfamily